MHEFIQDEVKKFQIAQKTCKLGFSYKIALIKTKAP